MEDGRWPEGVGAILNSPSSIFFGTDRRPRLGLGNGYQALADGRPDEVRFKAESDGENRAVEKADGGAIEFALGHQLETEPPGKITNEIEIVQIDDFEAGTFEFSFEIGTRITAMVAKVDFDRRVNLLARGDKQAKAAVFL